MRTLCLLTRPLPPRDHAGRARLAHVLRALRSLGPVDVVFDGPVDQSTWKGLDADLDGRLDGRRWTPARATPRHPRGRLRWLTRRSLPFDLGLLDPTDARAELRRFAAASPEPYDAVFADGATTSWLFGRSMRTLVLIEDLARANRMRGDGEHESAGVVAQIRAHVDRGRWLAFERFEGGRANVVLVGDDDEREALGVPGAIVIPTVLGAGAAAEARDIEGRLAALVAEVVADAHRFDGVERRTGRSHTAAGADG